MGTGHPGLSKTLEFVQFTWQAHLQCHTPWLPNIRSLAWASTLWAQLCCLLPETSHVLSPWITCQLSSTTWRCLITHLTFLLHFSISSEMSNPNHSESTPAFAHTTAMPLKHLVPYFCLANVCILRMGCVVCPKPFFTVTCGWATLAWSIFISLVRLDHCSDYTLVFSNGSEDRNYNKQLLLQLMPSSILMAGTQ